MRLPTVTVPDAAGPGAFAAPAEVDEALGHAPTGGQALSDDVRAPLEQAIGHNFAQVRIHANSRADGLTRSLNARAFTHGADIYFRAGAYQPDHRSGRHVLAHELTHVVQQRGAAGQRGGPSEASTIQRQVFANNWDKTPQPLSGPEIRVSLQKGLAKAQYEAMVVEVNKDQKFFYPEEPEQALVKAFDFIAADLSVTYTLSLGHATQLIADAKKYALSGVPKAATPASVTTKAGSIAGAMSFADTDKYLKGKGFASNTNTWMRTNPQKITLGPQIYTVHATINKASFPASLKNGVAELKGLCLNDYHISLEGDTPADNIRFYFDHKGAYANQYSVGNSGRQNGVPPGADKTVMGSITNLGSSFQQFILKLA